MVLCTQMEGYTLRVADLSRREARRLHWSFEGLAQAIGTGEERLRVFLTVRNEIKERIETKLLPKDG